jgi:integrase/recombinase XerD
VPSAVLSNDAEEFLSWLTVERGRAELTVRAYRRDLAAYEATLSAKGATTAQASMADVEDHLASLRASGHGPASIARAQSVLRGLHQFLVDEHRAASDPTAEVDGTRLPSRLPKALSEDEVARLLATVQLGDPRTRRDRALLELLYGTGARISEAVGLDLADLAGGDGLIRLFGKGSKERIVPIGRMCAEALDAWLCEPGRGAMEPLRWRRRDDSEAVFLNLRGGRLSRQGAFEVVAGRAREAGITRPVSPHALRHSCATHMLAHGADIRVVQELLGHVSIGTTQLYTKVSAEHLRNAYESAHPRAGRRPAGRG